jgi:uncharacterized repeat protein (TIGR03803 family)
MGSMEIPRIGGELCRSRRPVLTLRTGSNWMPRFQLMVKILGAMLFFASQRPVDAQLTILHNFGDGTVTNDGATPEAGLIQAPNGDFFGVTTHQAIQTNVAAGTVFQMTPTGEFRVIYRFGPKSNLWSTSPLFYYHGKLIGVTPSGPSSTGTGTLFALSKSAPTSKWRLSLWQKNIGLEANVILGSDGNFYGVGIDGVFKISPTTHQVSTVLNTDDYDNFFVAPGLVEGSDGNFYGSTIYVRDLQYISGAIFQLTPSGQVTFTQFQALEGTGPMIQASNGTFYGVGSAYDSGTTFPGLVFSYTPNGTPTFLHLFGQGSDGTWPVGALVQGPNGDLYGVTSLGGTAGAGILFEVSTLGVYTILHNFGDGSIPNDGLGPQGTLIVGKDNNLYGTTSAGGKAGLGTVFKFTP